MARKKDGVNKSEEIRKVLGGNPKMKPEDVVSKLAEQGVTVSKNLVYYQMGNLKGRRGRRKKAKEMVAKVATTTGSADAVATILKVKALATDLGGLKRLKTLVDAMSQ